MLVFHKCERARQSRQANRKGVGVNFKNQKKNLWGASQDEFQKIRKICMGQYRDLPKHLGAKGYGKQSKT